MNIMPWYNVIKCLSLGSILLILSMTGFINPVHADEVQIQNKIDYQNKIDKVQLRIAPNNVLATMYESQPAGVNDGPDKGLSSDKVAVNNANGQDNNDSSLRKSHRLGHTERLKSESNQPEVEKTDTKSEQQQLDQGLIEAQIDDVLSSAEFLALEHSAEFAPLKADQKTNKESASKSSNLEDDPEFLLNQLDESDLMDYVAEDDLWKEQLTIEDYP